MFRSLLLTLRWLSVALALTSTSLWVASIWLWICWEPMHGYSFMVSRGAIGLARPLPTSGISIGTDIAAADRDRPMRWHASTDQSWINRTAWYPLWMPAAAGTLGAAATCAGHLRKRPPWLCAKCGYDRRGIDLNARCPECGASAAATSPRTSA